MGEVTQWNDGGCVYSINFHYCHWHHLEYGRHVSDESVRGG